ncbi:MAG TPA: TetR family transcriptional regulator [Thermoleophilaceae bacterium]|nr:TetR family transcriptional regulator [Thermoleophilaceae bacterium]
MTGTPATHRARGAGRRSEILEATVRLLGSQGPAGVTHRRVAAEAGVPLAATTYYFASKDDLLQEALSAVATRELERLQAQAAEVGAEFSSQGALGRALARVLCAQVEHERASVVAKFDVYVEAARHPPLRAAACHWIEGFRNLAAGALAAAGADDPENTAALLVASADGLLLQHLATGGDSAELARRLEALADALVGDGGAVRPNSRKP